MTTRFAYLGDAERGFELYRRAAILEDQEITTRDGRRLAVYTAGSAGAPVTLLVNPLASSCLFFVKLVELLAPHRRIVTWEMRGLPDYYPDDAASAREWDPETHAQDLAEVLAAVGADRADSVDSVIAYCSGSYLSLYAAARGRVAPSRIALIGPPLEIPGGGQQTLYQKTIPPLLARIARGGPKTAAIVRAILRQGVQPSQADPDYELHVVNNIPFTRDEYTYRYACLHAAWQTVPWTELLPQIAAPAAIFHGTTDELVHTDTAVTLSTTIPGARLQVYERQGHFAVYACDELIRDVVRFTTAERASIVG